jgi:DNA repair protein RecN (Recombination protein N)
MLTDLYIKNFAIIDSLHVAFQAGLNVLTGETGAGKSIIIDAVNLVLGGRASSDLIRTGADEASVEAVFEVADRTDFQAYLAGQGIDCDGELLVRRTIARSGKNRVFLNGSLTTLALLAETTRQLINIYGQHESQTLLRPEHHLELLDGCAGLVPQRQAFAARHAEYRQARAELARLEEGEREAARRLDLLSFQVEEITTAALQPAEEEELDRERLLLVNAEKLLTRSQLAYDRLYGGDAPALGSLQEALAAVGEIATLDPALAPVQESLQGAAAQLEDAALSLRDYANRLEADPERLQSIDDRLDLIGRLKRKYGPTVAAVLAYRDEVAAELRQLVDRDQCRDELTGRLAGLAAGLAEQGAVLTGLRTAAATEFSARLERELHQLAMPHAQLTVLLEPLAEPRETGCERVEFLLAPNPGEDPRPLARIASGGELSRLMLAIKQLHPASDVPTLVFDEVDTGIGGATSAVVGRKLKKVAAGQQVLCITHLPQVAAYADHHYQVVKRVQDGRTVTGVNHLTGDDRVGEMARMLGGETITDTTLDHAREMILHARTV